jgi:hypothetical protein
VLKQGFSSVARQRSWSALIQYHGRYDKSGLSLQPWFSTVTGAVTAAHTIVTTPVYICIPFLFLSMNDNVYSILWVQEEQFIDDHDERKPVSKSPA